MKVLEIKRSSRRVFDAVLKLVPQLDPDAGLPDEEHFTYMISEW